MTSSFEKMRNTTVYSPADASKVWDFATLQDLHTTANALLRQAMLNERCKRWSKKSEILKMQFPEDGEKTVIVFSSPEPKAHKVITNYTELLWMISLENLPDDYEPPSVYSMLLYELYYHLGVAYQHKQDHQKAVEQFSNAIEAVSIAKNGCLAGCLTNSCLMTPIYTRKAFAHACLGSYNLSLQDAETAVVLDSKSPEVYCIRALVKSTFDDELLGLKDLDIALKMNPRHLCATMLKASFTKPLAARIFQESNSSHINCNSFNHPSILDFYDKFLFPLSVPHTVTVINLKPEKPSKKQLESNADIYKTNPEKANTSVSEVFRCGTPKTIEGYRERIALQRRTDYGKAIRNHMARPKSASEFFSQLEKHRKKQVAAKRAQSALVRPGSRFATLTPQMTSTRVPTSTGHRGDYDTQRNIVKLDTPDIARVRSAPKRPTSNRSAVDFNIPDQFEERKISTSKTIVIETPNNYSIPIFQPVNIKFAPRMYYRPWMGDKLPAKERPKVKLSPAFY